MPAVPDSLAANALPSTPASPAPPVSSSVRRVARWMWAMPALLALAALGLTRTPLDIAKTLREGTPATARVVSVETTNRSEVSYDALTLRAPVAGGDSITQTVPLPHGIAPLVMADTLLPVRVLPGAAHPIVITQATIQTNRGPVDWDLGRSQVRIAAMSCAMCAVGALLLAIAVGAWNRYLARHGDPGERTVAVD